MISIRSTTIRDYRRHWYERRSHECRRASGVQSPLCGVSHGEPLRDLLTELIDFERLRAQNSFEVMICATNVRTARRRPFRSSEISADAVLASAPR
jgi:hypothetical protein